jgi:hypothetical protein
LKFGDKPILEGTQVDCLGVAQDPHLSLGWENIPKAFWDTFVINLTCQIMANSNLKGKNEV